VEIVKRLLFSSVILYLIQTPVFAVPILLDHATLYNDYGISSSNKGKNLEDALNNLVFNPLGITLEVASYTGTTSAVDDFTIEGPGLTVIGGAGFILRFDSGVSSVDIQFGNYKDNFGRAVYAFDSQIDYLRGPAPGSQHPEDNFAGWTENLSSNIDFAVGEETSSGPLTLSVSDAGGNIESIYANTQKFLTSLEAIDVEFATVPEPFSLFLSLLGMATILLGRSNHGSQAKSIRAKTC